MYNSRAAKKGHLAQLVEHALDVRRVTGSSPVMSTITIDPNLMPVGGGFGFFSIRLLPFPISIKTTLNGWFEQAL